MRAAATISLSSARRVASNCLNSGVKSATRPQPTYKSGKLFRRAGPLLVTSHHCSHAHDSAANRKFVRGFETEYGSRLRPDYCAVAAHDALAATDAASARAGAGASGERLIEAFKGMKLDSPRGRIEIDAATREIVQTVYIRRTEQQRDDRWVNVEFDRFERVRDPNG